MGLDLELCGVVRAVTAEDRVPVGAAPAVTRLRDSHHLLARLLAHGLNEIEASHITGYSLSRISALKRDPLFADLMQSYHYETRDAARDLEALWLNVAVDYGQHIHEQLLDHPESVSIGTALEVFKTFADRGGMAPIARSVNKNLNVTDIGARLDRAVARHTPLAHPSDDRRATLREAPTIDADPVRDRSQEG